MENDTAALAAENQRLRDRVRRLEAELAKAQRAVVAERLRAAIAQIDANRQALRRSIARVKAL